MRDAEEVAREVWQAVADSIHRDDQSAVDAMAEVIRARDAEVAARAWDEGFTRGFYTGASGQYGPASDASEPDVTNPYERTEATP